MMNSAPMPAPVIGWHITGFVGSYMLERQLLHGYVLEVRIIGAGKGTGRRQRALSKYWGERRKPDLPKEIEQIEGGTLRRQSGRGRYSLPDVNGLVYDLRGMIRAK